MVVAITSSRAPSPWLGRDRRVPPCSGRGPCPVPTRDVDGRVCPTRDRLRSVFVHRFARVLMRRALRVVCLRFSKNTIA